MPLSTEKRNSYEIVLRDQEQERDELQEQISGLQSRFKEVQTYIAYVSRRLAEDTPPSIPPAHTPAQRGTNKYQFMSVRWAILDLLNDSQPMTTAEVVDALKAAGVQSSANKFANNISAVLSSTMKEKRNEVEQLADGRWQLTETGKNTIAYLRTTPKFRRALPWS